MTKAQISTKVKERTEEIISSGKYAEARAEALNEQFIAFLDELGFNEPFHPEPIAEEDIRGFLESFDFPSEDDWAESEAESEADDYEDDKYQQYKERD